MAGKEKKAGKPVEQSFEESMQELESLIERIESGEIGLEESIKAYERGVDLIKGCRGVLGAAEQRVEELSQKLLAEGRDEEDG
ncbi:MAG: exodeoxyribonuclease VII small subunit [Phycisphaerales bacterium JB061]